MADPLVCEQRVLLADSSRYVFVSRRVGLRSCAAFRQIYLKAWFWLAEGIGQPPGGVAVGEGLPHRYRPVVYHPGRRN